MPITAILFVIVTMEKLKCTKCMNPYYEISDVINHPLYDVIDYRRGVKLK